MEFTLQEIMSVYCLLYGDQIYNSQFDSFQAAFHAAWKDFYFNGAETPEEFAEALTSAWQLTDEG